MTLNCEEKSAHSKATTLLALLMSQCSSLVVAQLLNTRAGVSFLQIIKAAWGVMVPREGWIRKGERKIQQFLQNVINTTGEAPWKSFIACFVAFSFNYQELQCSRLSRGWSILSSVTRLQCRCQVVNKARSCEVLTIAKADLFLFHILKCSISSETAWELEQSSTPCVLNN